jgi:Zn-dependent protease
MRIAGSWTIARPFGVPIRLHWSIPVFAFLAGGFQFAPGAWLASLLLILIHEAGHAIVVRRVGARALALDVLGFGGLCWWEGSVTPIQRACIAWGGVWAQMLVFVITGACVLLFGRPAHPFAAQMVDVALVANLWLIGLNLLPVPPLDGKEAWSLFPLLRRRFALRRAARAGARVRVLVVPHLDSKQIASPLPAPAAEPEDPELTPEVLAVLERARTIAREAALEQKGTGDPEKSARNVRGHDDGSEGDP